MVGGDALDFGGNYKLGAGDIFVVEGDEYDTAFFDKGPKFLHYRPHAVLLTAVEFDHADIYRDLEHVKEAFRQLVAILPASAPLLVASDFPEAVSVASAHPGIATFGMERGAEWQATHVRDDGEATRFDILRHGVEQCGVTIPQPGWINARNALGAFAMARALGLTAAEILPGMASFRGVARRQELVGDFDGIVLIDDFAHHPTAVAGVLAAIRLRYPARRIWAVFEPRSNTSRRKIFQREYVDAFAPADQVIIGGVFRKETDAVADGELFSPQQLASDLVARGTAARACAEIEVIRDTLLRAAQPGDVIVLMSNGSFGGLRAQLLDALSTNPRAPASQ
jgi:UDP-N-acetylmuramate: L-alanyl-gamma-D-glutamyl-meso-diaminopimelate ligase